MPKDNLVRGISLWYTRTPPHTGLWWRQICEHRLRLEPHFPTGHYLANLSVYADIEDYEEDEGDDAVSEEVQIDKIYFDVERVESESSWSYFLNLEGFQHQRCINCTLTVNTIIRSCVSLLSLL